MSIEYRFEDLDLREEAARGDAGASVAALSSPSDAICTVYCCSGTCDSINRCCAPE